MNRPRVIVALRDAESVQSVMRLACQLAKGMEGELVPLHVVEVPMATPLDAEDEILDRKGRQILSLAKRAASADLSMPIVARLVRARQAGPAIVGEAEELGAELIVMGYHQPHGAGDALLGSVVRYVAKHTPCRLVVQIPPSDGHTRSKIDQRSRTNRRPQGIDNAEDVDQFLRERALDRR